MTRVQSRSRRSRPRSEVRSALLPALAAVVVAPLVSGPAAQAATQAGCRVEYTAREWPGGFTADLAITNLGDPLARWSLEWDYADGGQRVAQAWNGEVTQSGRHVTLRATAWNAALATGAVVRPGLLGTWTASDPAPAAFRLNGTPCTGRVEPSPTSPGPTSPGPTSPGPTSPSPTSPSPSPVAREPHVDNPFAGGTGYVDPQWRALAESEPGGSRVSGTPTGIWIDRVSAVAGSTGSGATGSPGLRAHLEAALAQGATTVEVVLDDLPGRDCWLRAPDGDVAAGDLGRYRHDVVDPVVAIEADPRYAALRIVNVVEVNALPLLVIGGSPGLPAACREAATAVAYRDGVRYVIDALHPYSNLYTYLGASQRSWLGWEDNLSVAVQVFGDTVRGTASGLAGIDGFITNTADYGALVEPFLRPDLLVGGRPVRQSRWVDWNGYVDELSFAQALRTRLVAAGFGPGLGMLVDTSRNGWGGPGRPVAAGTSTDLDTYVDASRVDRRHHAANWCNPVGAGLGERPRANPADGVDAYVWMRPPGLSDGASSWPGGVDPLCDPAYAGDARNAGNVTDAMPGAPARGTWFPAAFRSLMANAYPPL